jgi:CheY-like chemotaxis protein
MNPARPAAPILIVDDNDEVRAAIAALLESHGYHVLFARDGREALRVLCGADVTPCLILLDLMMPLLDGWDFHAEQKRNPRLSAIPILVVSAHPLAALATNAGAAAVLSKPVDPDALLAAVEYHCAKEPTALPPA